jgi:nitrate/TMAO reductase-like tetraheme cytochrome c subunit
MTRRTGRRLMSRKWLSMVGLLAMGALAGAAILAATTEMVRATSTNEFCASACHSMQWANEAYQRSVHYSNSMGMRAGCADCHVPHHTGHAGPLEYLQLVAFKTNIGIRDMIAEVRGTISTREKWERERPRLSKEFEQWVKAGHSITCQTCHDLRAFGGDYSALTKVVHAVLLHADTVNCLKCHKHVGHVYGKAIDSDGPKAVGMEPAAETAPRR